MKKIALLFLSIPCSIAIAGNIPSSAIAMANRPLYNSNFVGSGTSKYPFEGYLKGRNKVVFESGIYADSAGKAFVRLDDQKMFDFSKDDSLRKHPVDFDSLIALTFNINGDTIRHPAIARDSEWIFNEIRGEISLFASVPVGPYTYMSFADNSLVKYDEDALRVKLSENKESKSLLQAKTLGTTISVLLAVTGVVVAVTGLLNSDKEVKDPYSGRTTHEFDASPLMLVGGGILLSSWIPYLIVKDNFKKAIDKYNGD